LTQLHKMIQGALTIVAKTTAPFESGHVVFFYSPPCSCEAERSFGIGHVISVSQLLTRFSIRFVNCVFVFVCADFWWSLFYLGCLDIDFNVSTVEEEELDIESETLELSLWEDL